MQRGRLGIEGRVDRRDHGAKPRRHLLQHVIAPDAEPVADDLHIGVTIAEMPSKLNQRQRRPDSHLSQGFGLASNQHDPTIVEHDAVAIAQRHGLVEVQQKLGAAFALQHDAAAMPVARIESDKVCRVIRIPEAGAANGPAALHDCAPDANNGTNKIAWQTNMSKPSTVQGKYSAAGGDNVCVRHQGFRLGAG